METGDSLDISPRLPLRFAVAVLAPLVLCAIFFHSLSIEWYLLLCALALSLTVPIALGIAELFQLELCDGMLCVRWWSFGSKHERIAIDTIKWVSLTGNTLRILLLDGSSRVLRIPTSEQTKVQRWLHAMAHSIPEPKEDGFSSLIEATIVERSHEGVKMTLKPVFAPPPWALSLLMALTVAALSAFLGLILVSLEQISWPIGALIVVVFSLSALLAAGRQIEGIDLFLAGPRLEVVVRRKLGAQRRSIPLADVVSIDATSNGLQFITKNQVFFLPLPSRTQATIDALRGTLTEQIELHANRRGSIDPHLQDLLSGAKAQSAKVRTPAGG